MAQNTPLLLRLVASSISAANHAGKIIRDVMSHGDLAIVEKVSFKYFFSVLFFKSIFIMLTIPKF